MADIPDLDIDVIEGPGHAGNRAALDAWATAVRDGINSPKLATASAPGAMSAAEFAKTSIVSLAQAQQIATLAAGDIAALKAYRLGWVQQQSELFATYAAGTSMTIPISMRDLTAIGTGFADGGVNGGGCTIDTASAWIPKSMYLVQNPSITPLAFSFRAKFPTPVTGQRCQIGLVDSANTAFFMMGDVYDDSVGARTNYTCRVGGVPGSTERNGVAIDANFHTFTIAWDLVKCRFLIDGTVIADDMTTQALNVTTPIRLTARTIAQTCQITDFCYAV